MKDKFIIIDIRKMDYMKDNDGNPVVYNSIQEAGEVCGMYEFPDAWVCQLVFNHIEK